MDHQDWNVVTISSNPSGKTKKHQTTNFEGVKQQRLEAETDELKHATVSHDLKTGLMKARTARGLTQKQLAQALNMQPGLIRDYECGSAIQNRALISRFETHLGCKLPRN